MAEPWKWNGEPTHVVPASSRFAIGVSALHGLSSSHVTWTVRIIVTRDGRGAPPLLYKFFRKPRGGHSRPSPSRRTKNNAKAGLSRNSATGQGPGTLISGRVTGRRSEPFHRDSVSLEKGCRNRAFLRHALYAEMGPKSASKSVKSESPRRISGFLSIAKDLH